MILYQKGETMRYLIAVLLIALPVAVLADEITVKTSTQTLVLSGQNCRVSVDYGKRTVVTAYNCETVIDQKTKGKRSSNVIKGKSPNGTTIHQSTSGDQSANIVVGPGENSTIVYK